MFRNAARLIAVGAIGLQGVAAMAGGPADSPLWGVGRLPIECVHAPCESKGLFPLNPAARAERGVIWFDRTTPPLLRGPAGMIALIHAAYAAGECLAVEGHFDGAELAVAAITGSC